MQRSQSNELGSGVGTAVRDSSATGTDCLLPLRADNPARGSAAVQAELAVAHGATGAANSRPGGLSGAVAGGPAGSPAEPAEDLGAAPQAPKVMNDTGLDLLQLEQLTLRLANLACAFTTEWLTRRLGLPLKLVNELCWDLRHEKMIEIQSELSPFNHRYAITQRGRDTANRSLETSGYLGPAPVPLAQYVQMLETQESRRPDVTSAMAEQALRGMVLSVEAAEIATLAAASGRGLFVFGPPGNGKTTLGRALRNLMAGPLWVPHALAIDNSIIRFFDSQMHVPLPGLEQDGRIDQRWIRVQRPFIMTGGEMTLQDLDLAYQPALKSYEAPAHVKANGGVFMIDDFGRQRVDPQQMLNRWIVPLEERVDFLTLLSGQKIRMPFKLLLIIATNLTPNDVADPAFLRRMGYRLRIDNPTVEDYRRIFTRYADYRQVELAPGLVERILARYQTENRSLRGCEPRDLIERSLDIIRLRAAPRVLDMAIIDTAWRGYFGGIPEMPSDPLDEKSGRR